MNQNVYTEFVHDIFSCKIMYQESVQDIVQVQANASVLFNMNQAGDMNQAGEAICSQQQE